jgi:hypothetical protein
LEKTMALRSLEGVVVTSVLLLVACGSDSRPPPAGGTRDAGASGGSGGASTGGASGGGPDSGSGGVAPRDASSDTGSGGTAGSGGVAVDAGSGGSGGTDSGATGAGGDAGTAPDAAIDAAIDAAPPDAGACVGTRLVDISSNVVSVSASTSVNLTDNPPQEVVDGDPATAWFGGSGDQFPVLTWTGTRDDCITEIKTTNTEGASIFVGWGYESVRIKVLDSTNALVFSQTVPTVGSPDPNVDVTIPNGVVGRKVVLEFSGLETADSHTTGGIAELTVLAKH